MPVYESRRAVICVIPAMALTPPPSLAGILDDLEKQLGVEIMKKTVVNIMQQSSKSFLLHLAHVDQVVEFMAMGLKFCNHLLEMSPAKNTTTVILERVPYGLPNEALTASLTKFGVVKSAKAVTHKGYGVLRIRAEIELKQDIPSRITVQGNPINVFYRNQPRSCFVCRRIGHEARNCPTKAKQPVADPPASDPGQRTSNTFAAVVTGTNDPPAPQLASHEDPPATDHVAGGIPRSTEGVQTQQPASLAEEPVADPLAGKEPMDTESGLPASHHTPPTDTSTLPSQDTSAPTQVSAAETGSDPPPPDEATQQDHTSLVPPTTQQLLDNLNNTPPAILHPRPIVEHSDSSQSAVDERPSVKRSSRQKKCAQPYSTPATTHGGERVRTTPPPVPTTGRKAGPTESNRFQTLPDEAE